MSDGMKLKQGTTAWFEMVGELMISAASAGLPPDLTVSLLERYTDGTVSIDDLVQGFRFDVVRGQSSFRVGVGLHEHADILIEVTAAAARMLNLLRSDDPAYVEVIERVVALGKLKVTGDTTKLRAWLEGVHNSIVARTR